MGASIYMNNAATSWPKAPGVIASVSEALQRMPAQRGRDAASSGGTADICRSLLARCFGVDTPQRIALTQNATHALNLAILGLDLKRGDEVVTSVIEHNSVLRPLARLEKESGVTIHMVGLTPNGDLDETVFDEFLKRSPRLVVLNHVSNVTGQAVDVAPLFARAKKAGALTLLDASQSLGHVSVKPLMLHADLVAFTGHKGLRGPEGTGGLLVGPDITLKQVLVGGTGVRSDLKYHPEDFPLRLECGTPNGPGLAGLATALKWHETEGAAFTATGHERSRTLIEGLRGIPGVTLYCARSETDRTSVVSFRVKGWSVNDLGFVLADSFGIMGRSGLHCAPLIHTSIGTAPEGTMRLSPSGATTASEVLHTLDAIQRLVA